MHPFWVTCVLAMVYGIAFVRWLLHRRRHSSSTISNHRHTNGVGGGGSSTRTTTTATATSTNNTTPNTAVPAVLSLRPPGKPFTVPYRYVVAPMVGQCDLPFRMQCRAGGSQLVYTPMFFADRFATDADYRHTAFQTCDGDRPLAVQFGANDAKILLRAARFVEDHCDAVDLNLGCPQQRAAEGHYGAYLLPKANWPLVLDMVGTCHRHLRVPIICKIRLLPDLNETITLCKLLEAAGCSLIAVHGRRLAGDRKRRVGPANLEAIRRIKSALSIPVLSNGNVRNYADVTHNLHVTHADGIMSGEAILANPALFHDITPDAFTHCDQYFAACERYGTPPLKWVADHIKNFIRPLHQRGVTRAMDDLRALGHQQQPTTATATTTATVTTPTLAVTAATSSSSSSSSSSSTAVRQRTTTTIRTNTLSSSSDHKRDDNGHEHASRAASDASNNGLLWGEDATAVMAPVRKIVEDLRVLIHQQQPKHNHHPNNAVDIDIDTGTDGIWQYTIASASASSSPS